MNLPERLKSSRIAQRQEKEPRMPVKDYGSEDDEFDIPDEPTAYGVNPDELPVSYFLPENFERPKQRTKNLLNDMQNTHLLYFQMVVV